jgi:hypothetical protein
MRLGRKKIVGVVLFSTRGIGVDDLLKREFDREQLEAAILAPDSHDASDDPASTSVRDRSPVPRPNFEP